MPLYGIQCAVLLPLHLLVKFFVEVEITLQELVHALVRNGADVAAAGGPLGSGSQENDGQGENGPFIISILSSPLGLY
mgnify:CR=1 FL=1